jgi:sugar/nucleoside kinase (ribokinase family)
LLCVRSRTCLLPISVSRTVSSALQAAAALLAGSTAADPWIVVKRGCRGCTAHTRRERVFLPALTVEALDTVGCGDSFAAAVVLGRMRGQALRTTLALANAVGAATATGRGAGRNVARAEHVQRLLAAAAADAQAPPEARTVAAAALLLLPQ